MPLTKLEEALRLIARERIASGQLPRRGLSRMWGGWSDGSAPRTLDEGLIIIAWLALWRPAEWLVYGWAPLRRKRGLYERLAAIRVSVRTEAAHTEGAFRASGGVTSIREAVARLQQR